MENNAIQLNNNDNEPTHLRLVQPEPKTLRVVIHDDEGDVWGGLATQTGEGEWKVIEF